MTKAADSLRRLSPIACVLTLTSILAASASERKSEGQPLSSDFVFHSFPIDGGQLSCAHRPGTGPTLVLIPGTFGDCRVFGETVRSLDKSLNLVIIENRGLGQSWPPPEEGSIEQCARDAILILDGMKIDSFYVGGHSLGGMISLEIGRTHPRRVRGIISIEGWTNAQAARDAFHSDMKSTLTPEQLQMQADYRKEILQRWTPEQVRDFGQVWRRWDGTKFLETTDLPILELYGDRAKPKPERRLLGLPDRRNIELFWFERASHSLLMERPEGVARQINRFIRETETNRTP